MNKGHPTGYFSLKGGTIVCSLGEEPVKLSMEVPRQRFWLTLTFLLETISGVIIYYTINPNNDILALGFELNIQ